MPWHVDNSGENNPSFKGDKAGYGAIHAWVRRRKIKPELCEKCKIEPPRNIYEIYMIGNTFVAVVI